MNLPTDLRERKKAQKRICRNCRKSIWHCFDRFLWEYVKPHIGEELLACHYFDSVYEEERISNAIESLAWLEHECNRMRGILAEERK
jgi:hypothetical protein